MTKQEAKKHAQDRANTMGVIWHVIKLNDGDFDFASEYWANSKERKKMIVWIAYPNDYREILRLTNNALKRIKYEFVLLKREVRLLFTLPKNKER